jgi:hypothetical protein
MGLLMTPPGDDIGLLRITITEKSTEWEATRVLLKRFKLPNEVPPTTHACTTTQLRNMIHKLCTWMMALLLLKPSTNTAIAQQEDPSSWVPHLDLKISCLRFPMGVQLFPWE